MSANEFMGSVRKNWRQRSTERTTFKDELRIVPRGLLTLVIVLYLVALAVGEAVNYAGYRGIIPDGEPFPQFGVAGSGLAVAGLITAGAVAFGVLLLFYGYIYADAKRRGMSPVLWLVVTIFIPYLVGVVIYFIVREPLPFNCPQCGAPVTVQFNFCPRCQLNLRPNCPQCRREIASGDRFCRNCGAPIGSNAASQPERSAAPIPAV